MNISKTTAYDVRFRVAYFEDTEGGMDSENFNNGKQVDTIVEAIEMLELAKLHAPAYEWVIVADVLKTVNEKG